MSCLCTVMSISAFLIFLSPAVVIAEQMNGLPLHNPFSKPSILAEPKKLAVSVKTAEDESAPEITAILVSDTMPLVIAAGELLTLGETIGGYRLISVDEGKAIFIKNGNTYTFSLAGSGVEIEE